MSQGNKNKISENKKLVIEVKEVEETKTKEITDEVLISDNISEIKNIDDNDKTLESNELLIDLSTDEGYQYSVDLNKEKYLESIREKELHNKSIRPIIVNETELRQIGTRSKKGIEHIQLESLTRKPKIKMSGTKLPLEKATIMIPTCTGERDVYQFIKACDLACSAVDKDDLPILMKFINTKLFDQALNVCRYRDMSDWEGVKLILLDAFEPQSSTSTLQVALNSVRMRPNEDVSSYARRVEQLYFNLCVASTKGKTTDQATVLRDQLKEQTLVVFIKGLTPSLKTIVKSRNPPTLELAMQIAKDEETELKSESDAYQYYGNQNRNNNNNNNNNNNYNRRNNNNFENNNHYNNNHRQNNNNFNNYNYQRQNFNPRGNNNNFIRPNSILNLCKTNV